MCSSIYSSLAIRRVAALLAALVLLLLASVASAQAQSTPAGTVIQNRVQVRYTEPTGATVTTESPVVTVIVAAVPGVSVAPDETAPNGFVDAGSEATARFTVCNTGNQTTPYLITKADVSAPSQIESLYLDGDVSGTVTDGDLPVTLNSTLTPALPPAACFPVLVVYQVGAAPALAQNIVTLTARVPDQSRIISNYNSAGIEDDGTIRRTVRQPPLFTDPDDPNLPPRKLVNDVEEVIASPTQTVRFEVAFRNSGVTPARSVRMVDQLPQGLLYVGGSLRLTLGNQPVVLTDARDGDGGEVVGQTIEVRIPTLAHDEVVRISFNARLASLPAATVLINRAVVSADNAPSATSRDARVIVAPQGKVFDGESGGSSAVKATLRIVSNTAQGPLSILPSGSGYIPNDGNVNPYDTGADGMYSFRISPPSQEETYFLLCDAKEYKSRVIQVHVTPQDGWRFDVTLTALDGQPLAVVNGFSLTNGSVSASALGGFAWNIPMFDAGGIEVSKTVDRAAAEIGDVVSYRVEVHNTLRQAARGVVVRDTLPQSFYYVPGTALFESGARTEAIEPEIAGDVLTFHLPDIPAGATVALIYRVRIGVNARLGQQFNVAVGCHGQECSPPTRVGILVRGGVFSNNQLLIGRVFIDRNHNARFDKGDLPVAGASLVTSNGYTVITDAAGNYNYPVLGDGALSIELDKASVPAGFVPRDKRRADGSQWSRLLSTPLQRGALLHSSFPLVPESDAVAMPQLPATTQNQANQSTIINDYKSGSGMSVPNVEVRREKKRSFWSKLAFWRRQKSRPSSVSTTVIVPGVPCPPDATQVAGDRSSTPTPFKVEVSAPTAVYEKAPVEVNSTTLINDHAPAPVSQPAPSPAESPSPAISGAGLSNPIAPINYVAAAESFPAPPAGLAANGASSPVADTSGLVSPSGTSEPPVGAPAPAAAPAGIPAVAGVKRVAPGAVELDIAPQTLIVAPGFDVPVRVAFGYQARLYLNDMAVDTSRIGERRIDHTSSTEQVTFVGLSLTPGPNKLRAVAVSNDGVEHELREVTVFGRGPAVRLEIVPERTAISAGRREKTGVIIKAFDAWGNPALDGDIAVQTSAGSFDGPQEAASVELARTQSTVTRDDQPSLVARPTSLQNQLTVQLVGGKARVSLVAADAPGEAHLMVASGSTSAQTDVRFVTEADAPRILVGIGNITFGRAAPVMDLRQVDETVRGSLAFFFRGRLWSDNVLTLSYDSQRPLQRIDARDRLFQIDPLERNYSVFGDSSTRFNSAPSNSKLYARLDLGRAWGRSYAMFGDFIPDARGLELAAYNRRLTGVQVQFENSRGDYVSVGGARPNTVFGRDVFPGDALGFVRLSASLILPGSETVTLEVRDRRNPDIIIRREPLLRGADYNLDPDTGQLFFIRSLQAFDSNLDLQQVVVTYEYEAQNSRSNVYTARVVKKVSDGGSIGLTAAVQSQGPLGNFVLGGFDMSQRMPNGGLLRFEYARSNGKIVGAGNFFSSDTTGRNDGEALLATYDQPFKWHNARLQMSFRRASKGFLNPFGGTIVGGSQRAGVALDLQATSSARLRLGFTDERNETESVNNSRQTAGFTWTQQFSNKISGTLGYDFRRLNDSSEDEQRDVTSHMLTLGLEWRPTDRIQISARREQNLGDADPTYPTQTIFSGSYRINDASRFFITQRLSNSPITPISDTSGAGFGFSESRHEFNAGIETKFLRDTSLVGGYRLEQGQDGNDGFAIIGLTQKWKLNETLALDAGYERAFHLTGKDSKSGYNNLTVGATWQPRSNFVANTRYQFRDRDGSGQLFAAGFAGKPFENVTALGRVQYARGSSFDRRADSTAGLTDTRESTGLYGSFGIAVRPVKSDRVAAFFNYQYRNLTQGAGALETRERSSTFSADAFLQALSKVALFGKIAVKSGDTSRPGLISSPTFTYLLQARTEYLLAPRWDVALEARYLAQPSTSTSRVGLATELGYWVTPDIRLGGGYNFNRSLEQPDRDVLGGNRRGFYLSITTKLERVFNFFNAQKKKD